MTGTSRTNPPKEIMAFFISMCLGTVYSVGNMLRCGLFFGLNSEKINSYKHKYMYLLLLLLLLFHLLDFLH